MPIQLQPTVTDLLKAQDPNDKDQALAAQYAPILRFDAKEPFLPSVAGYTIFHQNAPSPSFPRQIEFGAEATIAIEYAIWWDWDIQHLYELEHVWVYIDQEGQVIRAEASWHGGYHAMVVNGKTPLTGKQLTLYSEPGKHAFAPSQDWLDKRYPKTLASCTRLAGAGGVWITPLFKGIIEGKTPQDDQLVRTYLRRFAFEPSMKFAQIHPISPDVLIPWPALSEWIPKRVAGWIAELERTIPPHQRYVLSIAHRGASAHSPENTLAAIVKAAELGANAVELDVHMSADGIPVIIHDANLSRTTNGSGIVSRHTLSQLKQLDAGNGETIPTLEEAVDCCRKNGLALYLEIKSGMAAPAVAHLIHQHDLYHGTIVTSFRPDWLADIKAIDPDITTSILFGAVEIDAVALAQSIGAEYVHPAWEARHSEPHRLLTPDWIARVRAAGLGIICWHEERPAEIAALLQLGVDAICSNNPELVARPQG